MAITTRGPTHRSLTPSRRRAGRSGRSAVSRRSQVYASGKRRFRGMKHTAGLYRNARRFLLRAPVELQSERSRIPLPMAVGAGSHENQLQPLQVIHTGSSNRLILRAVKEGEGRPLIHGGEQLAGPITGPDPPDLKENLSPARTERLVAESMLEHPEFFRFSCAENTAAFLRHHSPSTELKKGEVLLFIHKRLFTLNEYLEGWASPPTQIRGRTAFGTGEWGYHAVFSLRGRIYDYHYRGGPGTGIADYVEEMFGSGETDIDVIRVPVADFLDYSARSQTVFEIVQAASEGKLKRLSLELYRDMSIVRFGLAPHYGDLPERAKSAAEWGSVRENQTHKTNGWDYKLREIMVDYDVQGPVSADKMFILIERFLTSVQARPNIERLIVLLRMPHDSPAPDVEAMREEVRRLMASRRLSYLKIVLEQVPQPEEGWGYRNRSRSLFLSMP